MLPRRAQVRILSSIRSVRPLSCHHPALVEAIRSAIAVAGGRITFAQFMERALYQPQYGYYTAGRKRIGKQGDYFTSVSVGPLFGRILAHRFRQFRQQLGQPPDFQVVEVGGHHGQLRDDVRAAAPDLDYQVVEVGDPLPERIVGCVFSNELLDALPVHRVQVDQGEWREVYVAAVERASRPPSPGRRIRVPRVHRTPDNGGTRETRSRLPLNGRDARSTTFTESLGPLSDPRLATALAGLPVHLMEGYRTEVNLRALDWFTDIARALQAGFVVTVDYGYEREQYFSPHHPDGHLQCYHRHTRSANPYAHVGEQDITAHVEFTSLIELGNRLGLKTEVFTDQSHYLLEAGEPVIREIVERTAGQPSKERQAIQQLIHPALMGRSFRVLQQRKVVQA